MPLLAFVTVPVLAISVYGYLAHNHFIERVLAPIVIPLVIFPAIPVVIFAKSRWLPATCGITAVALIFSFVSTVHYLQVRKGTEWREAVSLIETNLQEDDGILVLPRDARHVFNFYFVTEKDSRPVFSVTSLEDLMSQGPEPLKGNQRLWVLRDRVVGGGKTRDVLNWLKQQYVVQRESNLNRLDVLLIQPSRMRKNSLFPSSQSVLIEYDAPRAMHPAKEAQHARD